MEDDSSEPDSLLNRRQYVAIVGASSFALAGCSGGGDDEDSGGNGGTDGEAGTETDREDGTDTEGQGDQNPGGESGIEPKTFSGSGSLSGETVQMADGLVVGEATHGGSGTFEVTLEGDQFPKYLATAEGQYSGKEAVYTDESEYTLNVVADGSWELTIRQPRADSGDSVPVTYSGSGSDVVGPVNLPGEVTVRFTNNSSEFNASVTAYPQIIDNPTPVFGFVGPESEGETQFPGSGISWIDVSINTDTDWTLEFE